MKRDLQWIHIGSPTFAIALRELRVLFLSPMAWFILAVVTGLVAWLFLAQVEAFLQLQPRLAGLSSAPGVTDLVVAPALASSAIILLLVTPLLTMRALAEERRSGTLSLLRSAPVSSAQIVIGKFLGLMLFQTLLVLLLALMPLSLLMGTDLDLGKLLSGLLGLWLMTVAFIAAGLFVSASTDQPLVAAVGGFALLLMFWIVGQAGETGADPAGVLDYLSIMTHLQPMLLGLVDSADLAFFGLFILLFLGLGIHRLEAQRVG